MPETADVTEGEPQAKQPKLFTRAGLIAVAVVVIIQLLVIAVFWMIYRRPPEPENPQPQSLLEVPVLEDWLTLYSSSTPQRATALRVEYNITVTTQEAYSEQVAALAASSQARIKQKVINEIKRLDHQDVLDGNVAALKEKVKAFLEENMDVEGAIQEVIIIWKVTMG